MEKNRVKIVVEGKAFTLMGVESEEHIKKVGDYIDEKAREVRNINSRIPMDSSLSYILTAINVADDYFKEQDRGLLLQQQLEALQQERDKLLQETLELKNNLQKTREEREFAEGKLEAMKQRLKEEKHHEGGRDKNRLRQDRR